MAQASRTFRIFVSSTFADLKAERDALQRDVFPRLRELCERHGARFQAIDLRWGVSEEASLDHRAIPICLTEIARCQRVTPRPNFIVLLGDRYGWRPLPPEIPADDFQEIERKAEAAGKKALLGEWYERDDNAVPAVYCLKPRAGRYEDFETWEKEVEGPLGEVLVPVSATEQEIVRGALEAPRASEHVFAFFRTIKTKGGRPLVAHVPADGSARDFVDQLPVDGGYGLDEEAHGLLEKLKDVELRPLLGDHVHDYEAEWTGSGISTNHISALCEDVWKSLSSIIERQIEELEEAPPLEREIAGHRAFGEERIEFFVGRESDLETIDDYVGGSDPHLLAVVGEPGSGKSALMAKVAEQAAAAHPDAAIVVRFIGATPASSDGRALLDSLCRQISSVYEADVSELPTEYRDLVVELRNRLALATAERPLIVFLDALDQLSDAQQARNLVWLPGNLPEHVRVVVSALPGECEEALERKHPAPQLVRLGPLSREEGEQALGLWLEKAERTLEADQRREVLDKFDSSGGLPLYLKLAFEEARLWRSNVESRDTVLREGIEDLVREDLFGRLAEPANHGEMIVSRSLGYLAASRYGLSEDELVDVLSADADVKADFRKRSPKSPEVETLPVVVWSRLYFDLEPYLTERSADGTALLAFYHRQLEKVAKEAYLANGEGMARHGSLADYFKGKSDSADDGSWTGGYERGLSELPYHLAEADRLDDLFETLTDFRFLEHKAAEVGVVEQTDAEGKETNTYTGVFQLQDDFELALAKFGGGEAAARRPLIVTTVDFGEGLKVRCPWCNTSHPFQEGWRGDVIECPNEHCKGPLKVNEFVVERP